MTGPARNDLVLTPEVLSLQSQVDELRLELGRMRQASRRVDVVEVNGPSSQDPALAYRPYASAPVLTQFALPFSLEASLDLKRIFVPLRNGVVATRVVHLAVAVYRVTNPSDIRDQLVTSTLGRTPMQLRLVASFAPLDSNLFLFGGTATALIADLDREAFMSPGAYALVFHSDEDSVAFEGCPDFEAAYRVPLTCSQPAASLGDFPASLDTGGVVSYNVPGPYALMRSRVGVHVHPISRDLEVL